ncbi:hypothetical protein TVAG_382970 [Trichomonas vaginalis G3]|uniref:Uncharacterized protein n=1 Tax=Trichomonas vaginalis (strain ATCC PRA-98 / G3) TaxID=412133 RepID=A2FJM5_TRIV3|nr:hypothetical protein TVAG_382970 [Trichomonas vaginalis G3]|eukprot:XP_001307842.1 hypothetical protein [Trichomonas vaginalis G3]
MSYLTFSGTGSGSFFSSTFFSSTFFSFFSLFFFFSGGVMSNLAQPYLCKSSLSFNSSSILFSISSSRTVHVSSLHSKKFCWTSSLQEASSLSTSLSLTNFKTSLPNVLWFLSYSQKQNFRTNSPFCYTM